MIRSSQSPGAEPVAAFVTTFRLGRIWQHGEVLLMYNTGPNTPFQVDLFDRVGTATQSTLKAGFLVPPQRPAERDKQVRARRLELTA